MINKLREKLKIKCDEIDTNRNETRIKFETSMTLLQQTKDYLEKLIFDIDEYHYNLVENASVDTKSDTILNPVCINCYWIHPKNYTCLKGNLINVENPDLNVNTCNRFRKSD